MEVGGDAAELTAASSSLGAAGFVGDHGAAAADRNRPRVRVWGETGNEEGESRERGVQVVVGVLHLSPGRGGAGVAEHGARDTAAGRHAVHCGDREEVVLQITPGKI